jgi:predicted nucleotidyltransferase
MSGMESMKIQKRKFEQNRFGEMSLIEKKSREIRKVCQKYPVACLILFGSQAKGEERKESDIDVGVLFEREIPARDELQFFYDLINLFGTDRVDLVNLNRAGPVLQKEVALYGEPLFEREKGLFDEYLIRALNKYQDTKDIRKLEKELLEEFIKKG